MRRILLLAKRDYLQTVASRGYLVGLILFPLLFGGGFLFLPLANRGQAQNSRIAVLDHTGVVGRGRDSGRRRGQPESHGGWTLRSPAHAALHRSKR